MESTELIGQGANVRCSAVEGRYPDRTVLPVCCADAVRGCWCFGGELR